MSHARKSRGLKISSRKAQSLKRAETQKKAKPRRPRKVVLLITCEHGGNRIPLRYKKLFRGANAILRSHRGWDIGALKVAQTLARARKAPLIFATVSRLIIDLNRTNRSRTLFSSFTSILSHEEKRMIFDEHYLPYWKAAESKIQGWIDKGLCVLHVSIHSFTPVLNGNVRRTDISVLYDPKHANEKAFSDSWIEALTSAFPHLRIRRNNPYRGDSDSLTRHLRRRYPTDRYMGFELEMNQRIVGGFKSASERIVFVRKLNESLKQAIATIQDAL